MRIVVCGGRDFTDRAAVFSALDRLHAKRGIAELIHGAARGADSLAREWAESRGVLQIAVPANWDTHGKRAGPIRNAAMLAMNPDGIVAFPGGRGTAHMIEIARKAGVAVWTPA